MRMLQKVAELPEVQKRLGIKQVQPGQLQRECRVFDPQMLQQVVEQLAGELRPVDRQSCSSSCRARSSPVRRPGGWGAPSSPTARVAR